MRKVKKTKPAEKFSFHTFLHRVWISFLALITFCFIVFNIWGYYSGFWNKKLELATQGLHSGLKDAGFTLTEILIEGRNLTSMNDICKLFDISKETCTDFTQRDSNTQTFAFLPKDILITSLDIDQLQEKFKLLPWVKEVTVRRQLPDILYIKLVERNPIALWQKNKKYYPLDEQGEVVKEECPECIQSFLLVVGNDAPKNTPALIEALSKHDTISDRIVAAKWVDNRRWNLHIDDIEDGKKVLLPDSDLEESLNRLEKLQKERGILDKQIEMLDLRIDDRSIIKVKGKESIITEKGDK